MSGVETISPDELGQEMYCDDCDREEWHTEDDKRPYPQCAVCGSHKWDVTVEQ